MHPVLEIPVVLLNIFCFLRSGTLAALARTCRAFKEPALDILWSELNDPSPLSRCLPEISHEISTRQNTCSSTSFYYSFTRPLEQAEWAILHNYARRVYRICDRGPRRSFDWKIIRTSVDLTPAVSLFPNLRSLHCDLREEIIPFLNLPFPSLIRLGIRLPYAYDVDLSMLQEPLKSLVRRSPKIKRLDIEGFDYELEPGMVISNSICSWPNLQIIYCPEILLNPDAVIHLSHMPSMTRLTCALSDAFLDRIAPELLSFTTLERLELHAASLVPVLRLLSWSHLPAVTRFTVIIESSPSKEDFTSFMASTGMTGMGRTVQNFKLEQPRDPGEPADLTLEPDAPLLDLDDLRPCMAFRKLRHMSIDVGCYVSLSDDQLQMLGSAWPLLERLHFNAQWGWNGRCGITPNGLALLLATCPSLTSVALAIDIRGFIASSDMRGQGTFKPSSFPLSINVIDSLIEEESVDAMATFFLSIVPHFHFILTSWHGWAPDPLWDTVLDTHPLHKRWEDVNTRANDLIKKHWLKILQRVLFVS